MLVTEKEKKKKKKKKESQHVEGEVQCEGHFLSFFLLVFSPLEGENFLEDLGRKHPDFTTYFLSSLPNNTLKRVFISIFCAKFSIHSILPPNKHTLNDQISSLIIIK